ncbi:hypothetical protein B0H14DRAFT_2596182 [Mycena olivaceomarginata]|nr:hypothetical protein B0H14DRAFT_2596182 [Mycena olivaceomarginata]
MPTSNMQLKSTLFVVTAVALAIANSAVLQEERPAACTIGAACDSIRVFGPSVSNAALRELVAAPLESVLAAALGTPVLSVPAPETRGYRKGVGASAQRTANFQIWSVQIGTQGHYCISATLGPLWSFLVCERSCAHHRHGTTSEEEIMDTHTVALIRAVVPISSSGSLEPQYSRPRSTKACACHIIFTRREMMSGSVGEAGD